MPRIQRNRRSHTVRSQWWKSRINSAQSIFFAGKKRGTNLYRKTIVKVERRPLTSLLTLLAFLLLLIIIGSFLRKPAQEKPVVAPARAVSIYSIGQAPKITVQAQIEKSGLIKIVALSGGVVSQIHVNEGNLVEKDTTLVSISSNYQGGNAPSLQRELAAAQFQNVKDTQEIQKEIIKKQREVAEKTDANNDALREITAQSIDDTKSLISLNETILSTLNNNLNNFIATNSAGMNDQAILSTRQLISQFLSATNQIRASLRNTEFQAGEDNPPAQLSNLAREIALKQLNLQEKALKLSLETAGLQLRLAQVQEATMFPSAPFSGTIERIHVNVGQFVTPGTPLLTLHGEQTVKVVAKVPENVARNVSLFEFSIIHIGSITLQSTPQYVTKDAIDGALFAVIYVIPSEFQNAVTNASNIPVEIPIGMADTNASIPFIPIDAVFQTQKKSYIFVNENGIARSRELTLGGIFGRYVEVLSGLKAGDQIILDRTVIEGDKVQ